MPKKSNNITITIQKTRKQPRIFVFFKKAFGLNNTGPKGRAEPDKNKKNLFIFLFLALACAGIFKLAALVNFGLELKDKVFASAMLGSGHLESAKDDLKNKSPAGAEQQFAQALDDFKQSQQELKDSGAIINGLLGLLPQKRDADRLLASGAALSQSGSDLLDFYQQLGQIGFSSEGLTFQNPESSGQALSRMQSDINGAAANIRSSDALLNQINIQNIPASQRQKISDVRGQLAAIDADFSTAQEFFNLLFALLSGQKNILILMENNNELRAGGGFIGSYGDMALTDGHINSLAIKSVYDLDGQLQDSIVPPAPLYSVNPRWFLRDANWFANFPNSAKKISQFYEKEGGQTPDAVFAVTPIFFQNLLKLTGPISMPGFGATLTADNFIEQTQAITSVQDNNPLNEPKQLLAAMFPILLQRLAHLDKTKYPDLIAAFQNSLASKNIVLYSRDSQSQDLISGLNWGGEIKNSDRDFLEFLSSNLGGTKTDLSVQTQIDLQVYIQAGGFVRDELTITRTNAMPMLDATNNLSYFRVLVPNGSVLISQSGFEAQPFNTPKPKPGQSIDLDAEQWQNSIKPNLTTGSYEGTEAGKTFFDDWQNLQGGQTKTIKLIYILPFSLSSVDRYSLMLQKQIGSANQAVSIGLHFVGYFPVWQNFQGQFLNGAINVPQFNFNFDRFFGLVIKK